MIRSYISISLSDLTFDLVAMVLMISKTRSRDQVLIRFIQMTGQSVHITEELTSDDEGS